MSLVEFKSVLKFIRGDEPTPEERRELYKEAALMALARATSIDANIKKVEVEVVQCLAGEKPGIVDHEIESNAGELLGEPCNVGIRRDVDSGLDLHTELVQS